MKKVLLLTLIATCCVTLTSFAQQIEKLVYSISKDSIGVEFTTRFTFDDLVQVKAELKKIDAEISYESLKFDSKGYLKQISVAIIDPKGRHASFTSRELQSENDGPGFRLRLK